MLVNSFDCSGAEPFKKGIYTGNPNYTSQRDFGRLVLSTYADKLFGHQAATSAITNDISLMESMLDVSGGCDANGTEGQRFNSWKQAADISNNDISNWDITQSNTSAKLAVNLTSKIVNKGISNGNIITNTISPVGTLTSEVAGLTGLGEIVKQVLGQDASRAMNQDNNELLPDVHQLLQFHEGDTIYVSIKVTQPAVSFGPGSANPGYTSLNPQFEDRTYMIKISLDAPAYSIASPPPPPVLADNTVIIHTIQSNSTISIRLNSDSAGTINWGDSNSDSISPNSVITINHTYNIGTYTITISGSIAELVVEQLNITQISQFSSSITSLQCNNNNLTLLPALPSSLISLTCNNNNLTLLPALPSSLISLTCNNNNLTSLPTLPSGIATLLCYYNDITQNNANNIIDNLVINGVEWGTLSIGLQNNSTLNINATDNWNNLQNVLGWDVA
jgi:hypothetical protein